MVEDDDDIRVPGLVDGLLDHLQVTVDGLGTLDVSIAAHGVPVDPGNAALGQSLVSRRELVPGHVASRVAEGRGVVVRSQDRASLGGGPVPVAANVLGVGGLAGVEVIVVVRVGVYGEGVAHLERTAEHLLVHVTQLRGDHEEGRAGTGLLEVVELLTGEFGRRTVVEGHEDDLLVLGLSGGLLQPLIHNSSRVGVLVSSRSMVRAGLQTVNVLDDGAGGLEGRVVRRGLRAIRLRHSGTDAEFTGRHRTTRHSRWRIRATRDAGLGPGSLGCRRLRRLGRAGSRLRRGVDRLRIVRGTSCDGHRNGGDENNSSSHRFSAEGKSHVTRPH